MIEILLTYATFISSSYWHSGFHESSHVFHEISFEFIIFFCVFLYWSSYFCIVTFLVSLEFVRTITSIEITCTCYNHSKLPIIEWVIDTHNSITASSNCENRCSHGIWWWNSELVRLQMGFSLDTTNRVLNIKRFKWSFW